MNMASITFNYAQSAQAVENLFESMNEQKLLGSRAKGGRIFLHQYFNDCLQETTVFLALAMYNFAGQELERDKIEISTILF